MEIPHLKFDVILLTLKLVRVIFESSDNVKTIQLFHMKETENRKPDPPRSPCGERFEKNITEGRLF